MAAVIVAPTYSQDTADPKDWDELADRLDHLLSFVEWPDGALADPGAPVVVGVVGELPCSEAVLESHDTGGHPLELRRVSEPGDLADCHVLWVGTGSATPSLGIAGSSAVLTVSDDPGFTESGGMIELSASRLEVNPEAARRGGIGLHPDLISVAERAR